MLVVLLTSWLTPGCNDPTEVRGAARGKAASGAGTLRDRVSHDEAHQIFAALQRIPFYSYEHDAPDCIAASAVFSHLLATHYHVAATVIHFEFTSRYQADCAYPTKNSRHLVTTVRMDDKEDPVDLVLDPHYADAPMPVEQYLTHYIDSDCYQISAKAMLDEHAEPQTVIRFSDRPAYEQYLENLAQRIGRGEFTPPETSHPELTLHDEVVDEAYLYVIAKKPWDYDPEPGTPIPLQWRTVDLLQAYSWVRSPGELSDASYPCFDELDPAPDQEDPPDPASALLDGECVRGSTERVELVPPYAPDSPLWQAMLERN